MQKFFGLTVLMLFFVLFNSCINNLQNAGQDKKAENLSTKPSLPPQKLLKTKMGTEVPVYDFEAFDANILNLKAPNTTYVLNFWATWCGPCVAELPYFFELEQQYSGKNVKFIYVSLDFMKSLEKKLLPFLEERKIKNEVIVLDQKDVNSWMEKIDKEWSGAIPATLIFNSEKRVFLEQNFESTEELKKVLNTFIR